MTQIATACTKMLVDHAVALGLDPVPVLTRHGVTEAMLADRHARIPARAHDELWQWLADELDDPDVGIHVTEQAASAASLGVVGYLARSSPTVQDAITCAQHYRRLFKDGARVSCVVSGDRATIAEYPLPGETAWPRARTDSILSNYLTFLRAWSGEHIRAIEARFQHPKPSNLRELERFFECPLQFEQPDNALVLPRDALALPLLTADPATLHVLEELAAARLASLDDRGLLDQVRVAVAAELTHHPPTIQRVARRLAVSTRSLQRQLTASGTSFRDVVDAIRHQRALELLRGGAAFADIAEQLGFSEPRAFRRAFQRWTGQAPSRWLVA